MKNSNKLSKSLGLFGIILCVACCTWPIAGVMLGVGSLSLLSKYFEWAGVAALLLALISFGIYYVKKKRSPACDIDCSSKHAN